MNVTSDPNLSGRSDQRAYLILLIVYFLYFVLLFRPFVGTGCDSLFYYTYLGSFLFDGDINVMDDVILSHNNHTVITGFLSEIGPKGLVMNQFAVGSALLWLPFVLPVRLIALASNWLPSGAFAWAGDRYAMPYVMSSSLAALVYGYLTLLLVYRICRFHSGPRVSLLAALGAVFASALSAYLFSYAGTAHPQSAFAAALLLWLCYRYRDFATPRAYVLAGAALALAVLVRWQNAVLVVIPAGFWIEYLLKRKGRTAWGREIVNLCAGSLVFVGIVSLQCVYWWALYGSFLTMPQGGGFMNWTEPHVWPVLFSGLHGLFYCHPLMLVAVAGLFEYVRRHFREAHAWGILLGLAAMTYVNAACLDWFGSVTYGSRRFDSTVPLFGLGLATAWSLLRGRRLWIGAAATALAMLYDALFQAAHERGMFDAFLFSELWRMRDQIAPHLWDWLRTVPLSGQIGIEAYAARHIGYALAILAAGGVLIGGCWWLARGGHFLKLERRSVAVILALLVLIAGFDLAIALTAPPADPDGVLFRRVIYPYKSGISDSDRAKGIAQLLQNGYRNPALYVLAGELAADPSELHRHLQSVYDIHPQSWTKWVLTLPVSSVPPEAREQAAKILWTPIQFAHEIYFRQASDFALKNNRRAQRNALKRVLRCNPFDLTALEQLTYLYDLRGEPEEAREMRGRRRRFIEAKVRSFIAFEPRIPPISDASKTIFDAYYHRYFLELGRLYEDEDEIEKAVDLYAKAERFSYIAPEAIRRRRVLEAIGRAPMQATELPRVPDDPNAPADVFVTAARHFIKRNQIPEAISMLQAGLQRHPDDPHLDYWLRNALGACDAHDLPFDQLLSARIDAVAYWADVAEFLIGAGRSREAYALLHEKVLPRRADHSWTNFIHGWTAYNLDLFSEAEAAYRKAWSASPDPAFATGLARVLLRQERASEALEFIARGLEREPQRQELIELKAAAEQSLRKP